MIIPYYLQSREPCMINQKQTFTATYSCTPPFTRNKKQYQKQFS